jgi:hypothetical protein
MAQNDYHSEDVATVLMKLGMASQVDKWKQYWEEAADTYGTASMPFLSPDYVDEQCELLNMADGLRSQIISGLEQFDRVPALRQLLWYCHYYCFRRTPIPASTPFRQWSALPYSIDPQAPLFYIYLFLSAVPYTLAMHRQLSIPQGVSIDTMKDLVVWIKDHRSKTGSWGLDFSQVGWLGLHFTGGLFQIGRLQFQPSDCYYDIQAYRQETDGGVVILADENQNFRHDGQKSDTEGTVGADSWESYVRAGLDGVTGFPIHPDGYAMNQATFLAADEWKRFLKKGDATVAVHIPGTGPMDFEACADSFERARSFFRTHWPSRQIHAFTCSSWILDPQFKHCLNPASNIVRFLREWYLLPAPGTGGTETFRRVFGYRPTESEDLSALPRDTSLQRAVADHLREGGCWRSHGALMFPHNMNWGDQVYRPDGWALPTTL